MGKWRWNKDIASESESAARQQLMKILCSWTKVLSNERQTHSAEVKDKNDNIPSDKEIKTKRWYEHFNEVLNREKLSNPVSILEIEAPDETEEIDAPEPTSAEKKEAKKHPKNGNARGIDNAWAELLKADIDFATIKIQGDRWHSVERRKNAREMDERIDS